MLVEEVKTMESRENKLKSYEVIFIRILMDMYVSEDQIHGIMAMLYGNKPAMDKVVAFIEENPEATESQIIKVASKAVGIKSKNDKNEKIKCKQCGEEFNNEELGLNGTCSRCRKGSNEKIREVHVAFDDSIYNNLYFRGRKNPPFEFGVDYQKVLLDYELCIGDISNPPFSNANAYAHKYSSAKAIEKNIAKRIEKINDVPSNADVYLWISDQNLNSYLNLCYFAPLFKRFENVFLVRICSDDIENKDYKILDSLEKKKNVTSEDLDYFSLQIKNKEIAKSDYRIGIRDIIKPCSSEWIGRYILNNSNSRYKETLKIFSDVHDNIKSDTGYIVRCDVVLSAINDLVLDGLLCSHGDYMWWGDSHHNNMLCTQRIKKCNLSNSRPLSYEDSLFCVLQAFEMGLTYPLYEILDKDAIIEYVDENKTVCGSRKIIEHIENDGTDRVCVNNQKVFCDIMRIAEGDRYGVGEKCILISYEQQNEVKKRIVKIKYADGKIRRIEVFIPYGPLRLEYDEDDLFECKE